MPSCGKAAGRERVAERRWSWFASRSWVCLCRGRDWEEVRKREAIETAEEGDE